MLTRTCKVCSTEKPVTEFAKSKRGLHGVRPTCKACERPARAAYTREWSAQNPELKKAGAQAAYAERRARIIAMKMAAQCADCGWSPSTPDECKDMAFDHIDPATKTGTSTGAAFSYGWAWERIEAELALCELRCTDCHNERTTRLGHRQFRRSTTPDRGHATLDLCLASATISLACLALIEPRLLLAFAGCLVAWLVLSVPLALGMGRLLARGGEEG